jgi:hypothetical protein
MFDLTNFYKNGFSIIHNFFQKKEIYDMQNTFKEYANIFFNEKAFCLSSVDDQNLVSLYQNYKKSNPAASSCVYDSLQCSVILQNLMTSQKTIGAIADALKINPMFISHFFRTVRIDFNGNNPNELDWHQDFMTSEKSGSDASRGITIWAPLHDVCAERGSLELCVASHTEKVRELIVLPRKDNFSSEYLSIPKKIIDKFEKIIINIKEGDVVLMNMNTIHRTYVGSHNKIRLTMIGRFIDINSQGFIPGSMKFHPSKV